MRKHLGIGLSVPLALAIVAFGQAPARAVFITTVTPTVTPQGGGVFLYSYNVANSPNSTVGVAEFDVDVYTGANLASLTNPVGFLALYTAGDSFVQFLSTDPASDIAPGTSGVFSFTSIYGPALANDLTRGFDPTGAPAQNAGRTLAPVPEPSALVLFGLGLAALPVVRAYRRRAAVKG